MILSDNGSDQLLGASKFVNKQYLWRERQGAIRNVFRLFFHLRAQRYDYAYALYPNGKRETVLLFLAKALCKRSYVDREHYFRLFHFLPAGEKREYRKHHDLVSNLLLVGADGTDDLRSSPTLPTLPHDQIFAKSFFERSGIQGKFVIALHPGGIDLARRWNPENYAALSKRLVQIFDARVLVMGSKSEKELVETISMTAGPGAIPLYDLNIGRVSAILQRSQLFIGNDSAPMHIAAALDVPVIAVWGYTDFERTAPFGKKALLIRLNYPCNPCYLFAKGYIDDCQHHLKCIRDISVEQVYRTVEKYAFALLEGGGLELDSFDNEISVESVKRLESGCLMVTLKV